MQAIENMLFSPLSPQLGRTRSCNTSMFPAAQREPPAYHFVPRASGPGTGHLCLEPSSVLSSPSPQVFTDVSEIPLSLLFSRLSSPSSQPLLTGKVLQSYQHLGGLPWTLSSTPRDLMYWGTQNWTQHSKCGTTNAE